MYEMIVLDFHDLLSGTSSHRNICRLSMDMDILTELVYRSLYRLCKKIERLHQLYKMQPTLVCIELTTHRCPHISDTRIARSLTFRASLPPLLHVTFGEFGAKIVPNEKQAYTKFISIETKCA